MIFSVSTGWLWSNQVISKNVDFIMCKVLIGAVTGKVQDATGPRTKSSSPS